ncbi:MAG: hypothetical protein RBR30_02505 [Tenuifilaceae bacterium]|nr:hypothetical protein [Tenuifilaceae bacterium]
MNRNSFAPEKQLYLTKNNEKNRQIPTCHTNSWVSIGLPTTFAHTSDPESKDKVTIGGYGQVDFNKPFIPSQNSNSKIDIHRMVLLMGYQYYKRLSFLIFFAFEKLNYFCVKLHKKCYGIQP